MNTLEWLVWGIGCLVLLIGLSLTRSGRIVGRAAMMFCVGTTAGLAITLFTRFSKFHLLWILPAALGVSLLLAAWLGVRKIRTGIQEVAKHRNKPPSPPDDAPGSQP